jgi:hypothetical protein
MIFNSKVKIDAINSIFSESFSLVNDPIKAYLNKNSMIDLNDIPQYNRNRLSAQFPSRSNFPILTTKSLSLFNGINKIGIQVSIN